ncbi:MAG: transcriptional antiterminator [Desulfobacteraceae bacterium 4572_88]|nr:MAG: transcriptional antiterminator [Desulfobacteraceae bacterium 4572_88]
MTSGKLTPAWYALHTRSRFENVVSDILTRKSVEIFLPKIEVRSKRRDRKKMIHVPLFPGYLFVRTNLDPREHLEILKTKGAVRLVGNNSGPVSVPSESIISLNIMLAADKEVITGTRFKKGNRVIVARGPFAGMAGTFVQYKGTDRVVVHIGVLGQFAAVEINAADIEILSEILS